MALLQQAQSLLLLHSEHLLEQLHRHPLKPSSAAGQMPKWLGSTSFHCTWICETVLSWGAQPGCDCGGHVRETVALHSPAALLNNKIRKCRTPQTIWGISFALLQNSGCSTTTFINGGCNVQLPLPLCQHLHSDCKLVPPPRL